jgi:hypothetical protein
MPSPVTAEEPGGAGGNTESPISRRIERLPAEVGVLLLAAGVTTGMLPPPPGPFDLTIIASGGLVLWPRAFRAIDGWTRKRFPRAHGAAMCFLGRYLDDLERRYPESLGGHPSFNYTAPTGR